MLVLFNYVLNIFSIVLFILFFGYGIVLLTKDIFYLFLVFSLVTLLIVNLRPLNKAKEIRYICNSLKLDENQNSDKLVTLSIEFKKKENCVFLKVGKFCPDKKEKILYFKNNFFKEAEQL